MKRLQYLIIALALIFGILLLAVADVNHGYGPEYEAYQIHNYEAVV